MARHFSYDEEEATQAMPATRVRPHAGPVPTMRSYDDGSRPYGQSAPYRTRYASAALTSGFRTDDLPARGGLAMVGRGILLMCAWVVRMLAIATTGLVLVNVVSPFVLETYLMTFMDRVWSYVPWGCIERLSVDTPFGGTFYGDLAIVALVLFVLDWILCRMRAALR